MVQRAWPSRDFANNHSVNLDDTAHRLQINEADAVRGREKKAVPQTAKEKQALMRRKYIQSVLMCVGAE
jgi:hypothetical protein